MEFAYLIGRLQGQHVCIFIWFSNVRAICIAYSKKQQLNSHITFIITYTHLIVVTDTLYSQNTKEETTTLALSKGSLLPNLPTPGIAKRI